MARINVLSNVVPELELPILFVMKNSHPTKKKTATPSVFQVATHLDEFVAANPEFAVPLSQKMPFADLMMHPEKVEAVLKTAENQTQTGGENHAEKVSEQSLHELKQAKQSALALAAEPDKTTKI